MDAHEELEHRAQVINDRLKANPASPTRTQSGNKRKVASPPRPQQTEPEKKTVTINPVPLPSSLSDIMRACIEYVSLLVRQGFSRLTLGRVCAVVGILPNRGHSLKLVCSEFLGTNGKFLNTLTNSTRRQRHPEQRRP